MGSYKKKLFIVLLVTLLIGFYVCGSVNASEYYQDENTYKVDPVELLKQQQEYLAYTFLTKLENGGINYENMRNQFKTNISSGNFYCYFKYTIINEKINISCYYIPTNIDFSSYESVNTGDFYFYDAYFSYPITGYNLQLNNLYRLRFRLDNSSFVYENYTNPVFLPSCLIMYNNSIVNNYINGISPTSSPFALIYQAIQANTEQQEETTNEMKELNNFMKSEDVDQNAYDMPSTNPTQDPTTDGINNIFNKFYTRINSWDSSNIQVYIPFANKSFWINANASELLLAKFSNMGLGSTLKSLISAVWFYVLARYIIKDVQKYADGLKTGEILTKSDTNIKTEML